MPKAKELLIILLSFLLGVALASFISLSNLVVYGFFLILILALILLKKKGLIILIGLFFLWGFLRLDLSLNNLSKSSLLNFYGLPVTIEGLVSEPVEEKAGSWRMTVKPIKVAGQPLDRVSKILVFLPKFSKVNYHDQVSFECFLRAPEQLDTFDYPGYLASQGITTFCLKPQNLQIISSCQNIKCLGFRGIFLFLKDKVQAKVSYLLPSPQAELLLATMFGARAGLPTQIQENFSQTGTAHIVAVSGLHITILTILMTNLFLAISISKKKSFWLTFLLIFIFIGLVGFKASAIRAGLMGLLASLALITGRLNLTLNSIFLAAFILLLLNPLLLVWDVGFELSFLAVSGLYFLMPYFKNWLRQVTEKFQLRSSLAMTLSAQVFVFPWLLYKFEILSLISPLANILILPLMPLVMGLGLGLVLISFIWQPLALALSWPIWLILSYIMKVVNLLVKVPFSSLSFKISFWQVAVIYVIIFIWLYKGRKRERPIT